MSTRVTPVAHDFAAAQDFAAARSAARAANREYRLHLFGDCWRCAGGHQCLERERLERIANVADHAAARVAGVR